MARALVIFESMFGNTRTVAEAAAAGISEAIETDLVEVGVAPAGVPDDVVAVVLGAPTHALGLSRPGTREDAARQAGGEVVSRRIGAREWLEAVESRPGVAFAAFDTRIRRPRIPGSAARAAERRARHAGFRIAAPAETFWVDGTQGPLLDGEVERARAWGSALGAAVAGAAVADDRAGGDRAGGDRAGGDRAARP
jgi:hypothetical protein